MNMMQHQTTTGSRADILIKSMSEAMRDSGEGCTDKDLRLAGFRQTDIDRFGDRAAERARRMAH